MKLKIALIGLGYVGLPLIDSLSKFYKVYGYDIDKNKINFLKKNLKIDELNNKKFTNYKNITFTNSKESIKDCNIYIVCVPTPVNKNNNPDFSSIKKSCETIAKIIKAKDIIVFESTFYPFTIRDIIIPLIENKSGLKSTLSKKNFKIKNNNYFSVGYSPERINPGDNSHTINKVVKILSATDKIALNILYKLYSKVVKAGVFKVAKIEIAESSKVIENIQRDINIALMNELKIIFDKLKINFKEILDAAQTKWNFVRYEPGMVGGHCISVDPYYLKFKAKEMGYTPKILLAGRKINNDMFKFYSQRIIKLIRSKYNSNLNVKILIMGFSYKPNVSDFRNTQIIKLYKILKNKYKNIDIFDPLVDADKIKEIYKVKLVDKLKGKYDCVTVLVHHSIFLNNRSNIIIKNIAKKKEFLIS